MTAEIKSRGEKSILIAHKDIGDFDRGGICVLFKTLGAGLAERNWKVHVVTTQDFTMNGVQTHTLNAIEDPREYSKAVTQVVETVKPDIAEASTWRTELLDYTQRSHKSSKVVVRADPSAMTLFSNVTDLAQDERVFCTNADLILAVSRFAKSDIESKYRVTGAKVVYNGIPEPTILAVTKDIFDYTTREVPKRILEVYGSSMGLEKALLYPLLDLTRRVCYDIGILKSRRFLKKTAE